MCVRVRVCACESVCVYHFHLPNNPGKLQGEGTSADIIFLVIDRSYWVQWLWNTSVRISKTLWADIFPIQTEETRNIYYVANVFQIWKELQENFIEPSNTQYSRSFASIKIYAKNSLLQSTISINLVEVEWNKLVQAEIKRWSGFAVKTERPKSKCSIKVSVGMRLCVIWAF